MQASRHTHNRAGVWLRQFVEEIDRLSAFQLALIGSLIALLAAGGVFAYMRSRPKEVRLVDSRSEVKAGRVSEKTLTVHVAGAVARPGLYHLREGSRVADAVSEAGGVTAVGRIDDLNLASRLSDGQKIFVPAGQTEALSTGVVLPEQSDAPVNINTSDVSRLEGLPGVGPELAERIVEHRDRNGPFSSVEELDDVKGIGPGRLKDLKDLVTI